MSPNVVAFGECMLELAKRPDGSVQMGFGGDTLNTALYLARLGVHVRYATALGMDPWSDELREAWSREGIGLELVLSHPSRVTGLYAIRTNEEGERAFTYWRDNSAARRFFDLPGSKDALDEMATADMVYLSGITLSLFDPPERDRLVLALASCAASGGQVVFDPNYRPANWSSRDAAIKAYASVAAYVTIVLPTFEDEALLHGETHPNQTFERWRALGVSEVVVKLGPHGAIVDRGGAAILVPTTAVAAVDTTGAGDSFNAGYLHSRLMGRDEVASALDGHALAGCVIRHRGAIVDREIWDTELALGRKVARADSNAQM